MVLVSEEEYEYIEVEGDYLSRSLTVTLGNEEEEEEEGENYTFAPVSYLNEAFLTISTPREDSATLTLADSQLSTTGILALINCRTESIRELSMSYSYLNEELLKALTTDDKLNLKTLRLEAHPDETPGQKVSHEAWFEFNAHLADINLILSTYLTEAKDYEGLIDRYVPLTHLRFGDNVPSSIIARVGYECPFLTELIIGSYGPDTIDRVLILAANGCPKLRALGIGDCEITCSGFVEFVDICRERLQILYVSETSLLEDSNYDLQRVTSKVSTLLGRPWQPNFVPYW